MTNLTAPGAEAASGLPNENYMSDVIDSLKRLERVGSEESKTTQKLIQAAAQLSFLIASQFSSIGTRKVTVAQVPTFSTKDGLRQFRNVKYTVSEDKRQLQKTDQYRLYRDGEYVADNREVALEFARDISKGLLDPITAALEKRQTEDTKAIAAIEGAAAEIQGKRETDEQ
jgi:hypothetical protein